MDDIIVFARTPPQELLDRLDQVLTRLHEVGLKIKPSKSVLFKTEVDFLGHVVTQHGVSPMPDKLEAIRKKKLQRLWTGPWEILSFITPLVVRIQHTQTHKIQTVHVTV